MQLMAEWCRAQPLPDARSRCARLPGRTPLLLVDVPGELPGCVLLYGHLDKQPEFTGWLPGLGPWEPVIRDGKLYGRGGADDGYAVFSSLTAIAALKAAEGAAPALRAADRGLRGKRQRRSAGAPRGAGRRASATRRSWSAWMPSAATTSRCGARPRCAAISPARCACAC